MTRKRSVGAVKIITCPTYCDVCLGDRIPPDTKSVGYQQGLVLDDLKVVAPLLQKVRAEHLVVVVLGFKRSVSLRTMI